MNDELNQARLVVKMLMMKRNGSSSYRGQHLDCGDSSWAVMDDLVILVDRKSPLNYYPNSETTPSQLCLVSLIPIFSAYYYHLSSLFEHFESCFVDGEPFGKVNYSLTLTVVTVP